MAWTWEVTAPTAGVPAQVVDDPAEFVYTVPAGGFLTVNFKYNVANRDSVGWVNPGIVYSIDGGSNQTFSISVRSVSDGAHPAGLAANQACWGDGSPGSLTFCSTDEALAAFPSLPQTPFTFDNTGSGVPRVIRLLGIRIGFNGLFAWNTDGTVLQVEIVSASQENEADEPTVPGPTPIIV